MRAISISRFEYKYWLRPEQLPAIQRFLRYYCVQDHNARSDWYKISSLYLDTGDYRLYQDAKEKLPWRVKLRIRGYGDGDGPVNLEVKRRSKARVLKTSAVLSRDEWTRGVTSGVLRVLEGEEPAYRQFAQFQETLRATPKILVLYQRMAFASSVDDYVRVTFDRAIRCQRVASWSLAADPRAWLPIDHSRQATDPSSGLVMEIKFTGTPPAWLRDFTAACGLIRSGYSKYVRAVERMNEGESAFGVASARWRVA